MSTKNKAAAIANECVACGCCVGACPFNAVSVHKGIIAKVDERRCVGCGKCAKACPACVISIVPRAASCEKEEVECSEEKALV